MKEFLGIVLCILIILVFVWVVQGNDFFMYKVFAPKYEQARRDVFEQSKAYNQGMIQELSNMYLEYKKTTDENAKDALKSVILHRVADYDESKLPGYLQSFVQKLRNENMSNEEMNY